MLKDVRLLDTNRVIPSAATYNTLARLLKYIDCDTRRWGQSLMSPHVSNKIGAPCKARRFCGGGAADCNVCSAIG